MSSAPLCDLLDQDHAYACAKRERSSVLVSVTKVSSFPRSGSFPMVRIHHSVTTTWRSMIDPDPGNEKELTSLFSLYISIFWANYSLYFICMPRIKGNVWEKCVSTWMVMDRPIDSCTLAGWPFSDLSMHAPTISSLFLLSFGGWRIAYGQVVLTTFSFPLRGYWPGPAQRLRSSECNSVLGQ